MDYLKRQIECLSRFHQIEVLRILYKHNPDALNSNKNGIHVNLSMLDPLIIDELSCFVSYVSKQEEQLIVHETEKEQYKNILTKEK